MTKVKICGITRPEEIEYLNELRPDYAGFVFYEKSKRCVTLEQAIQLMQGLKPWIRRVAVTVSLKPVQASFLRQAGFDIIQVHGEFSAEKIPQGLARLWRAKNIYTIDQTLPDLFGSIPEPLGTRAEHPDIEGYVIDGPHAGSGETFAWEPIPTLPRPENRKKQFILAGGLSPENVAQGIAIYHPDVVDVSSGVEDADGKSREKIQAFIENVRQADEQYPPKPFRL